MGRPGPNHHLVDDLTAHVTRFTVSAIHLELAQVLPRPSVREEVGKVVETGPTAVEGKTEHVVHSPEQSLQGGRIELAT
jgi:hypothetical protein